MVDPQKHLKKRNRAGRRFALYTKGSLVLALVFLLVFFGGIAIKGAPALMNLNFFINTDSREVADAGIVGALWGSFYVLLVALVCAVPIGLLGGIYLEEFASKNKLTTILEVIISNLASVPPIIFGLLGVAVFLQIFDIPRSSALLGGMTLALMSLPVIIVTTRTSLRAVPQLLRDAAYGVGASPLQVVMHHVLPLAVPGITTGILIALARVFGETAPLLILGMSAFILQPPTDPLEPATTLPLLVFNWSRNPEQGFVDLSAAAILVLLLIIGIMNWVAILIRRKFELRW
jgi:phosphate transport system permease protein